MPVYTGPVRNITLSADEAVIDRAREAAAAQHTTLNAAFRRWLAEFSSSRAQAHEFDALMQKLQYVRIGRKFSRDEMNER